MIITFDSYIYREEKYRGEVELPIEVRANLLVTTDAYATGDSPTLYEVDLLSAIIYDYNSIYDNKDVLKHLDSSEIEELENEAIEKFKENYYESN